ncbi:MAG: hypothetical protein IPK06_17120 [Ignavibacteriae bacterium]|nr:hypothetical protein [Ignavibacteriota bacterium]
MNFKRILLFVIFTSSLHYGQQKYFIYFMDKGDSFSKITHKESTAHEILSQKSIDRRKKNLGENYITYSDIPIFQEYIDRLKEKNIQIIRKLKWFNAVSALLNDDDLEVVRKLSFVSKVEKVKKLISSKPISDKYIENKSINKSNVPHTYDYGYSLTQDQLSDIPEVHDLGFTWTRCNYWNS